MKENLKNVLNVIWKIGVGLIGVFVLVLLARYVRTEYFYHFGRAYADDMTLSSDVVVRAYMNNRYKVYNKRTGHYTTRKLRWVSGTPKRDSLTVFCDKDGYRGFLNVHTGEIAIPAQYGKAWQFSEGLAAVVYGDKNRLGFINHNNELVIKDIPYDPGYYDYLFKDGFCIIERWDDINFEDVYSVYSSKKLSKVGEYNELTSIDNSNHIIAKDDDGYWLLDSEYESVFDEPYDYMEKVYDGDGVFVTHNNVKQYFDYDGTLLEPFVIDGIERLKYVIGLTEADPEYDQNDIFEFEPELVAYRVNDNYGLMNANTGKIITPAKYGDIYMISKELLRAEVKYNNNESVLLDRNGKEISE